MFYNEKSKEFYLYRMVPPIKVQYYFSINMIAYLYLQEILETKIIKVPKTNYLKNIIQTRKVVNDSFLAGLIAMPRPLSKRMPKDIKPKTLWDKNKSVFAPYMEDTDIMLQNCFEFDWGCCKVSKIVKEEDQMNKVKSLLKTNYQKM
jgi:hypothetical protein